MTASRLEPATNEGRRLALLWFTAVLSSLAFRPLWLALAPHLRPCFFRSLTGIPCPTCGTTRAATAFLNGDLGGAFVTNPLAALAGVVFVVGGMVAGVWAIAGWPAPRTRYLFPLWLRIALIGTIAVNWVYLITRS